MTERVEPTKRVIFPLNSDTLHHSWPNSNMSGLKNAYNLHAVDQHGRISDRERKVNG